MIVSKVAEELKPGAEGAVTGAAGVAQDEAEVREKGPAPAGPTAWTVMQSWVPFGTLKVAVAVVT